MSTPRPSTPDAARPSTTRAASYSVAPRSEILRNALHARRAQQTSTPTPVEKRPPPADLRLPQATTPAPHASPDVFDEFELSEEQTRPVSPINRRRPSDAGVPRPKTTRQLNQENEQLRAALMDANMRVQLLKTSNSELHKDNTKLKKKVEELVLLEQEMEDLDHENLSLKAKLQETEQEMEGFYHETHSLKVQMQKQEQETEDLKHGNDNLRTSNEEMISVLNECTAQMDGLELAMQEAVDTIFALESEKAVLETKKATWEKEKAALSEEVQFMKERMSNLEYNSTLANTSVDGSQRCPSRVYSIDEARPSTSHFDSDYFSQPDSPVVKPSRESVISVTPSERSKKFLDLTQERRQSARDLAKRMSTASLKALRISTLAPAPEVPEIPTQFRLEAAKIVEHTMPVRQYQKPPKRYRDRKLPEHIIQEALQISPESSESPAALSPLPHAGQLRAVHRSDHSLGTRSSSDSRPSSSHRRTPTTSSRSRHRRPSAAQASPRVPSRRGSRQVHTNSSSEHMAQHELRGTRQRRSDSDIGSVEAPQAETSEWASMPPPPKPARASVISQSSLTSSVDAQDDKDRWWKSIQPLTQHQQLMPLPAQILGSRSAEVPPSPTLTRSKTYRQLAPGPKLDTAGTRTQPSTPAATTPYVEKDFLFNASEDADTFMRKAKAKLTGRK
ncbi:hypothetical protein DE146DRAFT_614547 [Phaeosphaeria sp. MPI-PUGE-AT-0046c]|nr:hypothetical protein DE146DRAFT_614547 [Phaeosphaeria sp. MPI-PUGE-AT-0046c]